MSSSFSPPGRGQVPAIRVAALALPLCALLIGCLDERSAAAPPELASISQHFEDCGFACGDNGGMIDGVSFWELNLAGAVNSSGVKYLRFARSEAAMLQNQTMKLDVDGARLRAFAPNGGPNGGGGEWIEGMRLAGGVMEVSIGRQLYYIKILEVHTGSSAGQPYWTKAAGAPEYVETYKLGWDLLPGNQPPSAGWYYDEVCDIDVVDESWRNRVDALVFEGERYDIETKSITASPTTQYASWFNIACAGSLPAKMHLTRRTSAASDAATFLSTIADDRQAFARMWAADYCGDGTTFTVTGHKLRVRDRKPFAMTQEGWIPRAAPVGFSTQDSFKLGFSYEAVWGPGGAVCLDTPRLVDREEIEEHCGHPIPTCASRPWFPASWRDHGQVLSANPSAGDIIIAP
jgi:ADYC domain